MSRGGSWSFGRGSARPADRTASPPHERSHFLGFRLAREAGVAPDGGAH